MMKRQLLYGILLLILVAAVSCRKYLDAKPDSQQAVPSSLQDAQALLDNVAFMNRSFPNAGEAASDSYYVTDAAYRALSTFDRDLYAWNPQGAVVGGQWSAPYQVVNYANQVLETPGAASLRGAALFFRGYALLQVAGIFAPVYDPVTAGVGPGAAAAANGGF